MQEKKVSSKFDCPAFDKEERRNDVSDEASTTGRGSTGPPRGKQGENCPRTSKLIPQGLGGIIMQTSSNFRKV